MVGKFQNVAIYGILGPFWYPSIFLKLNLCGDNGKNKNVHVSLLF